MTDWSEVIILFEETDDDGKRSRKWAFRTYPHSYKHLKNFLIIKLGGNPVSDLELLTDLPPRTYEEDFGMFLSQAHGVAGSDSARRRLYSITEAESNRLSVVISVGESASAVERFCEPSQIDGIVEEIRRKYDP